jgi:hypothetical protein
MPTSTAASLPPPAAAAAAAAAGGSRPPPPPLPLPKKNLPPPQKEKQKQKQAGIPKMEECLDKLNRAVILKRNVSPNLKFTDKQALMLAGFTKELAENPTIVTRFRRILIRKQQEEEAMEAAQSLVAVLSTANAATSATPTIVEAAAAEASVAAAVAAPKAAAKKAAAEAKKAAAAAAAAAATRVTAGAASRAGAATSVPTVARAADSAKASSPARKQKKSDLPFTLPELPPPPPPPTKVPTKKGRSMVVVDPGASGVKLPPKMRRNSAQVNKDLKRKRAEEDIVSEAISVATRLYQAELAKKKDDRKSSDKVMEEVNKRYGTRISGGTLRRYLRAGMIGTGRKTRGRPVTVVADPKTNELCRQAYLTHIQLVMYKTKAKKVKLSYMSRKIQALLKLDDPHKADQVVVRLRKETALQHDKVIVASEYDDVVRANREACDGLIVLGYDGNVMTTDDDSLLPYPKKKRRKKASATKAAVAAAPGAAAAPKVEQNVGASTTTMIPATTFAESVGAPAIADPGFHHYYSPDGTAVARAGFL